ncbi:MAG: hypothetical protein DRJ47_06180 [Thermoprotei archaeon]|nr:MAG: hypothetical protein DRJ47_06180 [Thermoprotei archaeon]
MVQSIVGIQSDVRFPPDYKIYNLNDNILLRQYGEDIGYFTVKNRDFVIPIEKQDSNWLLNPGSEYNAGDISDWLQPNTNELYILGLSFLSDRNMEVRIFNPSSDQLYGLKNQTDNPVTVDMSPWREPRITMISWFPASGEYGKEFTPAFKIKNPTEYKNKVMKIIAGPGFRYQLRPINKPSVFDTVDLGIIR